MLEKNAFASENYITRNLKRLLLIFVVGFIGSSKFYYDSIMVT